MLAFTQLQALTGPVGSSQCLSGLLAFTIARSVTFQDHLTILRASSEFMRLACVHPTASIDWTRRVQSVLVRLACVHHRQIHNPTPSNALARRAYAVLWLSCSHLYPDSCLHSANCKHRLDPNNSMCFLPCQMPLLVFQIRTVCMYASTLSRGWHLGCPSHSVIIRFCTMFS